MLADSSLLDRIRRGSPINSSLFPKVYQMFVFVRRTFLLSLLRRLPVSSCSRGAKFKTPSRSVGGCSVEVELGLPHEDLGQRFPHLGVPRIPGHVHVFAGVNWRRPFMKFSEFLHPTTRLRRHMIDGVLNSISMSGRILYFAILTCCIGHVRLEMTPSSF